MFASVTNAMFDNTDEEIFGAPTAKQDNSMPNFAAVHAMFNSALKNGLTKAKFNAELGITLKLAPATGNNPGAIYLTQNDVYKGKIVKGVFHLQRGQVVTNEVIAVLRKIAANPQEYATSYGHMTGNCNICGRDLRATNSVALGIGPICAEHYGFTITAEEVEKTHDILTINEVVVNRKQLSLIIGEQAANILFEKFNKG
jgi:hypothetical protein